MIFFLLMLNKEHSEHGGLTHGSQHQRGKPNSGTQKRPKLPPALKPLPLPLLRTAGNMVVFPHRFPQKSLITANFSRSILSAPSSWLSQIFLDNAAAVSAMHTHIYIRHVIKHNTLPPLVALSHFIRFGFHGIHVGTFPWTYHLTFSHIQRTVSASTVLSSTESYTGYISVSQPSTPHLKCLSQGDQDLAFQCIVCSQKK